MFISLVSSSCNDAVTPECVDGDWNVCSCGSTVGERICSGGDWSVCSCLSEAQSCNTGTWVPCACLNGSTGRKDCWDNRMWGTCTCNGVIPDQYETWPTDATDYWVDSRAYRYVRVDDLSNITAGLDPGADIDAILVEKADGSTYYGETVEAYLPGVPYGDNLDPTSALGAPDSVVNYTDPFPTCNADWGFVSLGGIGYLVVGMAGDIEVGDAVAVIEVGGCDYGGGEARVETVKVQVSVSPEPDNLYWVVLGQGEGPYLSLYVSALPVVP